MVKQKTKQVFQVEETKEIEDINNKLHLSYIVDQTKPDVDKFERANLIKHYMAKNLISFSELSKQLNIGKGTLSGWLKWAELSKEEYDKLKADGMTESQVTSMLKSPLQKDKEPIGVAALENALKWAKKINGRRLNKPTIDMVTELRNELNSIL